MSTFPERLGRLDLTWTAIGSVKIELLCLDEDVLDEWGCNSILFGGSLMEIMPRDWPRGCRINLRAFRLRIREEKPSVRGREALPNKREEKPTLLKRNLCTLRGYQWSINLKMTSGATHSVQEYKQNPCTTTDLGIVWSTLNVWARYRPRRRRLPWVRTGSRRCCGWAINT